MRLAGKKKLAVLPLHLSFTHTLSLCLRLYDWLFEEWSQDSAKQNVVVVLGSESLHFQLTVTGEPLQSLQCDTSLELYTLSLSFSLSLCRYCKRQSQVN